MIETTSGHLFARKVVRLFGEVDKKDVENEIRAVTKLCKSGHANIVQVLEFGVLKEDSAWHFIDMELCDITLEGYVRGADIPCLPNWRQVNEQRESLLYENFSRKIFDRKILVRQPEAAKVLSPYMYSK